MYLQKKSVNIKKSPGTGIENLPRQRSTIAQHQPWNRRLAWDPSLIDHEGHDQEEADDQWCEDLSGVPWEANATEGKTDDSKRRPCDDDSVATSIVSR